MLGAIEAMPDDARALWSECRFREFNIGYRFGYEPRWFNNELSNETLTRMSRAGASLGITLYPPDKSDREDAGDGNATRY